MEVLNAMIARIHNTLLIALLGMVNAYGLPEGTTASSGGGSFSVNGSEMVIDAPNGSIFDHQSFNIAKGESVRFSQPGADSRVLNRINSVEASIVNGSISANGQVFFSSPAGMIFGENAVVNVGLLHVIGGSISDENFLNQNYTYDQLTGSIENKGTLVAREVVLAGSQVINSGHISADSGEIALVAGSSTHISSLDGALAVSVSSDQEFSGVVASDLAGHAVLQSGVLKAEKVQLVGSLLEHSGELDASSAKFAKFSNLKAMDGKVTTTETEIEAADFALVDASLTDSANSLGTINAKGIFKSLNLRSTGPTELVSNTTANDPTYLKTGYLILHSGNFRVSNGELKISTILSPNDYKELTQTSTEATKLVTASDKSLSISNPDALTQFDQTVVYAPNADTVFSSDAKLSENWHSLNAATVKLDDLSAGVDAATIFKLADENPEFAGFSNSNPGKVGNVESISTDSSGSVPGTPQVPDIANPSGSTPSNAGGTAPADPSWQGSSFLDSDLSGFTVDQLTAAMEQGLFSGYSYILKGRDPNDFDNLLSDAGGSSALFGGSFDVVSDGSGDSPGDDSSEDSEEGEGSDDSGLASDGPVDSSIEGGRFTSMLGAIPFAPIGRPVLSPQAAARLEAALSPEVEKTLQQYINR